MPSASRTLLRSADFGYDSRIFTGILESFDRDAGSRRSQTSRRRQRLSTGHKPSGIWIPDRIDEAEVQRVRRRELIFSLVKRAANPDEERRKREEAVRPRLRLPSYRFRCSGIVV